jgi:hypothetical protein
MIFKKVDTATDETFEDLTIESELPALTNCRSRDPDFSGLAGTKARMAHSLLTVKTYENRNSIMARQDFSGF